MRLPGTEMIPDGIVKRRAEYIAALRQADRHWSEGRINLQAMESLIEAVMANQLLSAIKQGSGRNVTRLDPIN